MGVWSMKIIFKKNLLSLFKKNFLSMAIGKKKVMKKTMKKTIKKAMKIVVLLLYFLGSAKLVMEVEGREYIGDKGLGKITKEGVKKAMQYEGEVRKYDNPKVLELNKKEVNKYANDATEKAKEYAKESYELKRKSFKGVDEYIKETKLFEGAGTRDGKNGNNEILGISDKCRKLVFISLSLSDNNLENIVREAKVRGWVPVMRGFKEGSYKKTAKYLSEMMRKTGYGVVIDPESFKEFEVKVVPTFVVAGVKEGGCSKNEEKGNLGTDAASCNGTKYNKIAGNVSFEYVEGVFNKSGGMVCG
jgi:type-F conjugative transfer system pilin assembly protein TrbC